MSRLRSRSFLLHADRAELNNSAAAVQYPNRWLHDASDFETKTQDKLAAAD
jgi:hypothetical protein